MASAARFTRFARDGEQVATPRTVTCHGNNEARSRWQIERALPGEARCRTGSAPRTVACPQPQSKSEAMTARARSTHERRSRPEGRASGTMRVNASAARFTTFAMDGEQVATPRMVTCHGNNEARSRWQIERALPGEARCRTGSAPRTAACPQSQSNSEAMTARAGSTRERRSRPEEPAPDSIRGGRAPRMARVMANRLRHRDG